MLPTIPDYDGAWVGGLLPELDTGAPAAWIPEAVHGARAVVLLVLDGLGWRLRERHADVMPTLAAMGGGPITTVAPSTTAAALTSITTAAAPAQHGVVGYRFRVGGEVLNALRWQYDGRRNGPKPAEVQPVTPFLGREVPVVSRSEFETTGFTAAHLRGGRLHGWRTPAGLVTHCRRLLAEGQQLVYAYYDGIDKVAHAHGLRDDFLLDEMAATDRLVADLLAELSPDAALLVTSDHGQVHVGAQGQRSLAGLDPYVAAYSGEGRFRSLHARGGAAADLVAAARETCGEQAWVRTREEVLAEGWLGAHASRTVGGRLGDVVLAASQPVAFTDPGHEQETTLVSMHGSLTEEEMLVPLVATRGG